MFNNSLNSLLNPKKPQIILFENDLPLDFYEDMDNIKLPLMHLVIIDENNDMEIEEEIQPIINNITCSKRFLNEDFMVPNKKIKKQ